MGERFWKASAAVLAPVIRRSWKLTVTGAENVPTTGAAILASNHLSYLDHYVTPAAVPNVRQVFFISKAQHFDVPVQRWLFRQWGVIPLKRGEGDREALERAREVLRDGQLLCIYPEGTRSTDGRIHKGRTGVARLALELGVPVIPTGVLGTDVALPKNSNRPRLTPCEVRFGKPLTFPEYAGMQDDRKITRAVTDDIMRAIVELTGMPYVDEYHHVADYAKREGKEGP